MNLHLGKVSGHVRFVCERDGQVVDQFERPNLILNNLQRQLLRALIGQGGVTNYQISYVEYGANPQAPAVTDPGVLLSVIDGSAAKTEAAINPALSQKVGLYGLTVVSVLGPTQGVGSTYNEYALCLANNYGLSRQVFLTPRVKTAGETWTLSWTLTFNPPA
jgi:hypothetical protein